MRPATFHRHEPRPDHRTLIEDRTLIQGLLSRAEGAEDRFFARHDTFIRKTICASSRIARAHLNDLTQDMYVHLWSNDFHALRLWKHECPLRGYLCRIIPRFVWVQLRRLGPIPPSVQEHLIAEQNNSPSPLNPEEPSLDIEEELARVLREERVRQYRDNERATWPGGSANYEEHQGPWLEARAALEFLRSNGLLSQ